MAKLKTEFDVAVVGGGISGLSMAHLLANAGLKTGVLEKEARAGGAVHTSQSPDGFWVELGAHTSYNSYGGVLRLMDSTNLTDTLIPREKVPWRLFDSGKVVSIASRLYMGEVLRGLPRMLFMRREGKTVAEYFAKVAGARNYREVVGPMLEAMTSQNPGEFPAGMLFKKRPRRKEILRSHTLPGGLQGLTDALATSSRITVLTGMKVSEIRAVERGYEIRRPDGQAFRARAVALATPCKVSSQLLEPSYPELARVLGRIRLHEFDSVGAVVRAQDVQLPQFAGLIGLGEPFYSVVSRDVVAHPDLRGFVFHFRPGVSPEQGLSRMAEVLGVPESRWLHKAMRHNVLPSPDRHHLAVLAELDAQLTGHSISVVGNYFGGMALEDCVQRAQAEAARLSGLLKAGA